MKKYFLFVMALGFLFLCAGPAMAQTTPETNADYQRVEHGETTRLVLKHSNCRVINNQSGSAIYVPIKSAAEWQSFYTHLPNGVTANACGGTNGACPLPWGGLLAHNASVQAHQFATVNAPAACPAAQTRKCTNGILDGSYTNQTCTVNAQCNLPWGGTIAHGVSVPSYSVASVTSPAACPAAVSRLCTNGTLGAGGNHQNCIVNTPPTMTWWGTTGGTVSLTSGAIKYFTVGSYGFTVNTTVTLNGGGSAGGSDGQYACAGSGGGGGGSAPMSSMTLYAGHTYYIYVGNRGWPGEGTYLYNASTGAYITNLQGGQGSGGGSCWTSPCLWGGAGGYGGYTYEPGGAGQSGAGTGGGGGAGGSCDWSNEWSGGPGGSGGYGLSWPGSSGGAGGANCYTATGGGGGGGWYTAGVPGYYGGGGGGGNSCGYAAWAGSGGAGIYVFKVP